MKTVREEFEAWAKEKPWFIPTQDGKERDDVDFVYADFTTDMAWCAWENASKLGAGSVASLRNPRAAASQKTGGSVDYYKCHVADPIGGGAPYTAESIDIIEALGMTFAEGEAFKAIWRTCTGRMGGAVKADNKALYNAEKVEFFGARMVRAAKRSEAE